MSTEDVEHRGRFSELARVQLSSSVGAEGNDAKMSGALIAK